MDMDDEFQIVTTPIENCSKKDKTKKNENESKSILNKVSKKFDLVSKDKIELKPKWTDDIVKDESSKVYDCLNITKILQKENDKIKKIKNFKVLTDEKFLCPGLLEFSRCNDGNRDYPSKKYISFSILHPTKKLLITGSAEEMLCLFKMDCEDNDAICKPMVFDNFPIKGGKLLPCGNKLIFFSNRHYYKVFNMTTSHVGHHSINKGAVIKRLAVSPSGDCMVFATQTRTLYVVSTQSFDKMYTMQVSGIPKSLAFSHNGKYLYAFESSGKISVFQFSENSQPLFQRSWNDHGTIEGVVIAVSPDNHFIACGCPGYVNIYKLTDTWESEHPKPVKTIEYEGTRINQLIFNHSSELLALGYCDKDEMRNGSYKLVHLATMSIFSNFPGPSGNNRPTSMSFSPNGKYLAVGQYNGKVGLYNLSHYNKY